MNSLETVVRKALDQRVSKKYPHVYWAIDLHDTVIEGKYNRFNVGSNIFPYAKEVLDFLYNSDIHRTILWTSSYADSITAILSQFNLQFHYINGNPECPSNDLCDFNGKFYFNVLLDDKAMFDPNTDWLVLKNLLTIS